MRRASLLVVSVALPLFLPAKALADTPEATRTVKVEGNAATLVLEKQNASDTPRESTADAAVCNLPCTAQLSLDRSYFTLGADGQTSRAFRISPFTEALVVRNGSRPLRTAGGWSAGLGAVVLGAGLGFFVVHAVANADNNPASAETAGTLGLPLVIGGAVTLALGLVLYAVSGTSIEDQRGSSLARSRVPSTPPDRRATE